MSKNLSPPILYLITRGATTETTSSQSPEFQGILIQIRAAAAAQIELVQIREKRLNARVLFELAKQAVDITRTSSTRILVNDRADIAAGAGAHGVHLTTQSLEIAVIRNSFGQNFLIGASTHSWEEAQLASEQGADFLVFGPIFSTKSKEQFGPPLGLEKLSDVCGNLDGFPVLALGGVSKITARQCLEAGASGVAGISLFSEPAALESVAAAIRKCAEGISDHDANHTTDRADNRRP
jgi:thiamine-phosphate pyrophosphorylase